MYESYEVGAQCWIPSPAAGWVGAEVTARREVGPSEVEVELLVDGGETVTKKLTEDPSPALPLRNPPQLEATSDLVTLSYLNEPSVLNAIRQRYSHLNIYTFSGIVLIATNPFARVDNLYTDEVVQMYNQMEREQLEPPVQHRRRGVQVHEARQRGPNDRHQRRERCRQDDEREVHHAVLRDRRGPAKTRC